MSAAAINLPREFLLAAACCRWPPSEARDEAVREAAREVDWGRFARILARQRVEGLAQRAVRAADVAPPQQAAEELKLAAAGIAQENLRFAAESIRLRSMLDAAGIDFLFVKGVVLAMLAYGELGVKKAWDIDLAVDPEKIGEACALLVEAGYHRVIPGPEVDEQGMSVWLKLSKETLWRNDARGTMVELHGGLVDNPRMLPAISVHSPLQEVAVAAGQSLPTLAKDELFAYLCVHGATHAWSRLKWIADVNALLSSEGDAEIERLYRRSLDLGAGRCSAQALLLCSTLFELSLPPSLEAELRGDAVTRWLERTALRAMAGRYVATELDDTLLGTVPIHVSHFVLGRGLGYKASEAWRKTLSPHDRALMPLPKALGFLYPILVLPRWLWRRAKGPSPAR